MEGTVVYFFAFDVAGEIRTPLVRELLSERPFPFQIRVGGAVPRDVPIYRPLTVSLKPETLSSNVGTVTLRPFVKVFDVGVLSISYEVGFQAGALSDLVPYHLLTVDGIPLSVRAERLCGTVSENLRPFMVKPTEERPPVEAYTAFCLADVGGGVQEWTARSRQEIAGLLCEEAIPERLANGQVDETMRHALSYTTEDVTVIDWDAALVVDRSGYFDDVLYMIELANLQLEEYKLLDDRLDRHFLEAYEDLEHYQKFPGLLFGPTVRLRALRGYRMDMTKMSEEVSNITKFVGDWYLARVYLASKDRFHLGHWESSVDQKLLELDRIYSLVQSDVTDRRMLFLELFIVALFIIDVVALLFARK
jgi:hypothetical protein